MHDDRDNGGGDNWTWFVFIGFIIFILCIGYLFAGSARAQNAEPISLSDLNEQIDQTNFVVGSGCSGTLISTEYRLILTAFHCIDRNIRIVEREERQDDGSMKKVRRERYEPVRVEQRDYRRHQQVGAISYQTRIVAHRKSRDLAVLQLIADNLRSTRHAQVLREDMEIFRGDRVIAVGNPRGLDSTVTSGIVSSMNRTFRLPWTGNEDVPMIQYDAAGAPGSSGGALYDSSGYLIGVTAAGRPGEFVLAIPVHDVRELLRDHCFAEAFDPDADDEACRDESEGEDE